MLPNTIHFVCIHAVVVGVGYYKYLYTLIEYFSLRVFGERFKLEMILTSGMHGTADQTKNTLWIVKKNLNGHRPKIQRTVRTF